MQMQAALAQQLAREAAEAAEKEQKVELREALKAKMKAWQQVRALGSSRHSGKYSQQKSSCGLHGTPPPRVAAHAIPN